MIDPALRAIVLVLLSPLVTAQGTLVLRDTITKALPISVCFTPNPYMADAHRLRLMPGSINLSVYANQAVEIRGTLSLSNCRQLRVASVRPLASPLVARAHNPSSLLKVDFFGSPGWTHFLYVGGLGNGFDLGGIQGRIHLDPTLLLPVGIYVAQSTGAPFATLSAPSQPNLLGVDFYAQSVCLASGATVTSNVARFAF